MAHWRRIFWNIPAALLVFAAAAGWVDAAQPIDRPDATRYKSAITTFADRVLVTGRDHYGPTHTPLFVDGLHVKILQPATWKEPDDATWILCNFANQQSLIRLGWAHRADR